MTERALTAVIQEAYVQGISAHSIDELIKALGMDGISKSQVSRLCEEIDEHVTAFLERPTVGDWPYLWIDATHVKVRQNGRIVSVAVIVRLASTAMVGARFWAWTSGRPRPNPSGLPSCASLPGEECAGSSWSSPTRMRVSWRRSPSCSVALDRGAAPTSCATPWPTTERAVDGSSRPSSRLPSRGQHPKPQASQGARSLIRCDPKLPKLAALLDDA